MSSDITVEAARHALGMEELRARIASVNIANAGVTGATAKRMDFSSVQAALDSASTQDVPDADLAAQALHDRADGLSGLTSAESGESIQSDAEVADMVAAGASYQALSEALSRHFGLLRLAISGRS
jgi:flagellar basal body rod protein FlgB